MGFVLKSTLISARHFKLEQEPYHEHHTDQLPVHLGYSHRYGPLLRLRRRPPCSGCPVDSAHPKLVLSIARLTFSKTARLSNSWKTAAKRPFL
ncbi:hypothetical protein MCOR27_006185 [Pyricularia oryzae]|uniref:Uncharacterized protein n=3 Tax=Pyricularia oryzae TaxID=318829 RepID=G4N7U9_PYRO7|nr:uncharacterized protein MGG_17189 [Pyricularia oryzae 70-15]ELQ44177.1 hypothetical protein OOU_Y34scaffold00095g22 [Pyricularia oryzae Y34]KAI6277080.1 hypothetical protein MCOR27_006185 [Pyricularia oryzae]EHA50903.1 hypothetical protein MGG_17189 [Pyricularia oryzae 70-15]KAI6305234.1 hypothetical protein MCOR29_010567 [Pyricularia oryzae]KAI6427346.1 hypothetical protein MCOR21_006206 [Pyricularia oryzae]